MVLWVDWQTTGDSLKEPPEQSGKTRPSLETLAVKAFGDMGQTARLCLIRDRFIAGHSNCDILHSLWHGLGLASWVSGVAARIR